MNLHRLFITGLLLVLFFPKTILSHPQFPKDSATVYKLLNIAGAKIETGQKDSAEFYFQQSGQLAKEIGFDNGFIKYTGDYTNFLYRELRYQEGLTIAEAQLEKSIETGDTKAQANAYNNIGLLYYAMSMMTKAAEYYILALKTSETSNDLYNQRKYHTNLASLFIDIKDFSKGHYYALKGYEISKKMNDSSSIARSLVNLIVVEVSMDRIQEAQMHSSELIEICKKKQYLDLIVIGYINLGDIYVRQKQYNKSVEVLKEAASKLAYAPPGYDTYVYHGLANALKELKQYTRANEYFEKCLLNAAETMPLADVKAVYLLGAELREITGNYKDALYFSRKHQSVIDSLAKQTSQQTIQEVEAKYQTSVKEREIAEQKLAIANHNNEINKKDKLILATSLGILLLLASGAVVWVMHRQKRKAVAMQQEVKLLEALLQGEERERNRTAKELHDAVASTLSAAKMQVHKLSDSNNLPEGGSKIKSLELIDAAVKEIRNISHNMAPNVLLEEGLAYAIENFCNKVANPSLSINTYFIGELPKLAVEYELLIYRIIQEAVNNIIKHASASEAVVQLTAGNGQLDITIEDDGIGFDPDAITHKGIGMSNLMNRIKLLHGHCEIVSRQEQGTSIYIHIALQQLLAPVSTQSPLIPA